MHLGKFHAAITAVLHDYDVRRIHEHIQSVIQQLEALASNPGNTDYASSFKSQLDLLRAELAKTKLNKPYPTLAALLNSIDARPFIGDQLFQRIEDLVAKNGMTPQLAASALRELSLKVREFYESLRAIDSAFSALHVEYESLDPGEGEIGISIPEPDGERKLSDLADTAKNWNKALRPFVELADPDHNPIAVRIISSSDWQFYLTAAPAVYLAISTAISQMNELLHKLIETKQLIAQLTEKGVSANGTAPIIAETDCMLENGTRALAENIVNNNPIGDAGRENELKNELTASLKFIAREMASNVTIEIRYLPPKAPKENPLAPPVDGDDAEVVRIEDLAKTAAQITRNMDMLRLDSRAHEILNLPAPDEDKD